jgi:NAD(P)-dependent dehydrogenase (short-subunit alcohol dehydrogenase family)
VLVHCVGRGHSEPILGSGGPMPLEDFRQLVEVNLISTFNMMRLAAADMAGLPPLANGERGVILSTASVSAYDGQSGEAAYSASKGGVVSMILPAARELGPLGIRVVGIAPGLFGTQTLFDMEKNLDSRLARQIPVSAPLWRSGRVRHAGPARHQERHDQRQCAAPRRWLSPLSWRLMTEEAGP